MKFQEIVLLPLVLDLLTNFHPGRAILEILGGRPGQMRDCWRSAQPPLLVGLPSPASPRPPPHLPPQNLLSKVFCYVSVYLERHPMLKQASPTVFILSFLPFLKNVVKVRIGSKGKDAFSLPACP